MKWVRFKSIGLLCLLITTACSELENPEEVTLHTGDNFQQANDNFPAGTFFLIKAGVHTSQRIHNPKEGNIWLGEKGAVMDGENNISAAFTGRAVDVTIEGIEIKKYEDNGIFFDAGQNIILKHLIISDTGSGTGEKNGALRFNNIENIVVSHNYLTRVTAGILSTDCIGPVLIEWNSGINIGRNFVQVDQCKGRGILIQYNTMERQGDYLREDAEDVEDWISLFNSEGTPESPIRILSNRARGHGYSKWGSFIMLGDAGGRYQIAENNIGVNPGQVGIGIAGGEDITVQNNILYSDEWEYSNVALYSADYSKPHPCDDHIIRHNRSLWFHKSGAQNNLFVDEINYCNTHVENNTFPDFSLNHSIWERSKAAYTGNGK